MHLRVAPLLKFWRRPSSILASAAVLLVATGVDAPNAFAEKKTPVKTADHVETTKAAASAVPESQPIVLGDKLAVVNLSKDFRFVDEKTAKEYLQKQGNPGTGVLGIIAPKKGSADNYFVVCRFEDCGYVNDDDAEKLNADEILNAYKEGNKELNEKRAEMKIAPYYIGKWAEKPRYDKATHQVIWAIEVKNEDSDSAPVDTINYNTRILGRRGVLSMNLVTDPKELSLGKEKVATLLKETTFNKGQTYAEYVPGTDKAAGYGLAGLILGGGAMAAAAKFGVLGVLWKWGLGILLVLKKFIIIAVAGVFALVSRLFKGKSAAAPAGAGSEQEPTPTESTPTETTSSKPAAESAAVEEPTA